MHGVISTAPARLARDTRRHTSPPATVWPPSGRGRALRLEARAPENRQRRIARETGIRSRALAEQEPAASRRFDPSAVAARVAQPGSRLRHVHRLANGPPD